MPQEAVEEDKRSLSFSWLARCLALKRGANYQLLKQGQFSPVVYVLREKLQQYVLQEVQFTSVCPRVEHTRELPQQAEL